MASICCREVPPLRYDVVQALKRDSAADVRAQRGPCGLASIERELADVDGVMLGRAAYHDPYLLAAADWNMFGDDAPLLLEALALVEPEAVRS